MIKRNIFIELTVAFLIMLFLYTGISKLFTLPGFAFALSQIPYFSSYSALLSIIIPILEIIIAILLIVPATKYYGLVISFGLMNIFTIYLGVGLAGNVALPCNCGGVLNAMNWPQHFVFNLLLLVAITLSIYWYKKYYVISGSRKPVIE